MQNLKSHESLIRDRLARELSARKGIDTAFSITDKGKMLCRDRRDSIQALFSFSLEQTQSIFSDLLTNPNVTILMENPIVSEGGVTLGKARHRATILRRAAIEHYKHNGRIACHACSFESNKTYGLYGKGYLESHHIIPICAYDGEVELSLDNAIKNVAPLCANCHGVVHLQTPALSVISVKDSIMLNMENPA